MLTTWNEIAYSHNTFTSLLSKMEGLMVKEALEDISVGRKGSTIKYVDGLV